MRGYELTVVFPGSLSEGEIAKQLGKVKELLGKASAEIKSEVAPAKKTLAYEIAKNMDGWYWFARVGLNPDLVADVDKKLRLEESIIRYLLVKAEIDDWAGRVAAAPETSKKKVDTAPAKAKKAAGRKK